MDKPLLSLNQLTKSFGGLVAVNNLMVDVHKGDLLGVIGPNGAGKSTIFNLISGVHKPSSGKVFFKSEDITNMRPDRVAARGLVRTFQSATVFHKLTVLENVLIGLHMNAGYKRSSVGAGSGKTQNARQQADEILDFTGLSAVANEHAVNLPYGYQKALGVAMGLATDPEIMMLDEPVAGMNAEETTRIMNTIKRIQNERGMTIMLVEHNMRAVMSMCNRIVVINYGVKIAEGCPDEICKNEEVIKAYLGADKDVT